MKNMLSMLGLLLLCSAGVLANYNLYLNEHETMRLLGECFKTFDKIKTSVEGVCL